MRSRWCTFKVATAALFILTIVSSLLLYANEVVYPKCSVASNHTAYCYTSNDRLILEVHTLVDVVGMGTGVKAFVNCGAVSKCVVSECGKLCLPENNCHTYRCMEYEPGETSSVMMKMFTEMSRIEIFGWILVAFSGYSLIVSLCILSSISYDYIEGGEV